MPTAEHESPIALAKLDPASFLANVIGVKGWKLYVAHLEAELDVTVGNSFRVSC